MTHLVSQDPDWINMVSKKLVRLTGAQIRAARALIRWSADELAEHSKLGTATIKRAEAQDGAISSNPANVQSIINAFEMAGVEFIYEGNKGFGVIVRRKDDNV